MRAEGFAVESICRVLREQGCQIAARTYRSWRTRPVAARTINDAKVVDKIRDLAWGVDLQGKRILLPEGLYGRRKMTALIRRQPGFEDTSAGAVDRAMRLLGLSGIRRSKQVRTTIPSKDGHRADDLLNRDFTAPCPDHTWVADFSYIRTWAGFCYVAFIVDVFAQRIVGWHADTSMRTDLVLIPLRMAIWLREHNGHPIQPGSLRAHSDAGAQYTSLRYTERLALEGIQPSIGSIADAYDNALMESINGLFKTECIRTTVFHNGPWRNLADVEYATACWVDWYNNQRLHSSLGYATPAEYEAAHYAALNQELQPV